MDTVTLLKWIKDDTEFYLSMRCGVSCYFSCVSELVWTAREYYGVLAREWETGPRDVGDLLLGSLDVPLGSSTVGIGDAGDRPRVEGHKCP